jgi:hypothetical protein
VATSITTSPAKVIKANRMLLLIKGMVNRTEISEMTARARPMYHAI